MISNITPGDCAKHIEALMDKVPSKRIFHINTLWDLQVPPSWRRPSSEPFQVNDLRLHLVRGGRGRYQINGNWIPMSKGLLMFFHPTLLFSHEADPSNPPSIISCHFDMVDLRTNKAVKNAAPPLFWTCQLGIDDYTRILPFFENLSLLYREAQGRKCIKQLQSTAIYQLFGLIQNVCLSLKNGNCDHRIEAARLYIEQNPIDRKKLLTLSSESKLGKDYFTKLFHRQVGMSPKSYWLKSRMEYARFLLVHGNEVKSVAAELGYSDPFVFSRLFKKVHGMSPSSFKFEASK